MKQSKFISVSLILISITGISLISCSNDLPNSNNSSLHNDSSSNTNIIISDSTSKNEDTTSPSSIPSSNDNSSSSSNDVTSSFETPPSSNTPSSSELDSSNEPTSDNLDEKIYPIEIEIKQNKDSYLFNEYINTIDDFNVEILFNNKLHKKVEYDSSKTNGWYFKEIYGEKSDSIEDFPQPFNKIDEYIFTIGYTINNHSITSTDTFYFEVHGGTYTNLSPDNLIVKTDKTIFNVGETFDSSILDIEGNWINFGGKEKVEEGDGKNGFIVSCDRKDLKTPFLEEGKYTIKIRYRDIIYPLEIEVISKINTTKLDFNYLDYNKNSYTLSDVMPSK